MKPNPNRIESLDLLRGAVMILMVIDHAREYANLPGVGDPVDITQTSPALFFTRWISHFCAPVFVLLAGVSARMVGAKLPDTAALSSHLLKRGLLLTLLEFTVVDFSWKFNWSWPLFFMQVIWVIGAGMILLAAMVHLPARVVGLIGAAMVFGHNLLDGIRFTSGTTAHYLWSILHQKNVLPLVGGYSVRTTYPLIPLIGVMALGYWLGTLFQPDVSAEKRKRWLWQLGGAATVLFVVLRVFNLYGEANRFAWQPDFTHTLMALGNVTKYPTSLQFLLMTLGPAMLALAAFEPLRGAWRKTLLIFGRTPMFYYIAHLYLLHLLGLAMALATGYSWAEFDFKTKITGMPAQFGFPLWGVYLFSAITIALLYPACRWYDHWRRQSSSFIARYI
ncbi:MAG TPA: heparan-alpha-glucosaminide N-acetyltransferase domain-containing protein [Blastocatellia bacterium]|nr:heparan-alpha-glucosaminide N-acetyltransferase domain-containing protein [Blastocatellia bacterium]HMV84494.1 heparan-alpha-glucosaminide N-acetyltransferase domain-containing protein [Blastocatellia bacterium]HMX24911.1 heparan-alpha-glucosaminide N-acetyltransferase domain-containing protein [Blastocatellia bacterium]HMY71701.1 heparan-alpha-glucosaminide N-acetyltransferase domain-containing protein [Blastocatellia bacterium]HMZ18133.1 heparan-alpha-glucosaminide N-acetyltransferase doma